jgi:hypothetical protein
MLAVGCRTSRSWAARRIRSQITEFDKWMLRDFWRHLKSRYGY